MCACARAQESLANQIMNLFFSDDQMSVSVRPPPCQVTLWFPGITFCHFPLAFPLCSTSFSFAKQAYRHPCRHLTWFTNTYEMPGKRAWSIGARECPSKQITATPLTEPSSADWDLLDYHNRKRRWEAGKRTNFPDCLALLLHLKIPRRMAYR